MSSPKEGTTAESSINPSFLSWKKQDQLLFGWLLSSLIEGVFGQVVGCSTSKEVWQTGENMFASQSRARIMQLRLQLQTTKRVLCPMSIICER